MSRRVTVVAPEILRTHVQTCIRPFHLPVKMKNSKEFQISNETFFFNKEEFRKSFLSFLGLFIFTRAEIR